MTASAPQGSSAGRTGAVHRDPRDDSGRQVLLVHLRTHHIVPHQHHQNGDFYDFVLNEKFFEMHLQPGDEKALARYPICNDCKQCHQLKNDCNLTAAFESGMRFIKQNIRGSRSTFRSDFAALFIERRNWRRDKFLLSFEVRAMSKLFSVKFLTKSALVLQLGMYVQ